MVDPVIPEEVKPEKPEIENKPELEVKPEDNVVDENIDKEDSNKNDTIVSTGEEGVFTLLMVAVFLCTSGAILIGSKTKRSRKMLSVFLCFTLLATMLGNVKVVQADTKSELVVSDSIEIDGYIYDIEVKVRYSKSNNEVEPSGDIVTRGEWIEKLINIAEVNKEQDIELTEEELPFTDIVDSLMKSK